MKKFIVKRLLLGVVILFFVSLIIYSIERSLPTSYVKGKAMAMSQKQGAKPYEELLDDLKCSVRAGQTGAPGLFCMAWRRDPR